MGLDCSNGGGDLAEEERERESFLRFVQSRGRGNEREGTGT